jgi:hypothetical protein
MIKSCHDKDGFFKYYTAKSAKLTLKDRTRKWSTPHLFNYPFDNQFDLCFEESTNEVAKDNLDLFLRAITSSEPFKPNQFGLLTPVMEMIRHGCFRQTECALVNIGELTPAALELEQWLQAEGLDHILDGWDRSGQ